MFTSRGRHGRGGATIGLALMTVALTVTQATGQTPRPHTPRDPTLGNFYIRSTKTGDVPTDAALRRTLTDGFPGTAMSGWKTALSTAQIDTLGQYLKKFSPF